MKKSVHIIKIGGALLQKEERLDEFLLDFKKITGAKILVHGGQAQANALLKRLGIKAKQINGRRITDAETLDVAVMTYAGLANKTLVAKLQSLNINALGLTGADLDYMRATKRKVARVDFGYVGDVVKVSTDTLMALLNQNIVPVCASLTHDGNGQMLNTNADTIAAEIAIAMAQTCAVKLFYCFDQAGILTHPENVKSKLARINKRQFMQLSGAGVLRGGIIPKLENALRALEYGVSHVRIGPLDCIQTGSNKGTHICP